MRSSVLRWTALVAGGGLVFGGGFGGGCLPDDFYVSLTGDIVSSTLTTLINGFIAPFLPGAAA